MNLAQTRRASPPPDRIMQGRATKFSDAIYFPLKAERNFRGRARIPGSYSQNPITHYTWLILSLPGLQNLGAGHQFVGAVAFCRRKEYRVKRVVDSWDSRMPISTNGSDGRHSSPGGSLFVTLTKAREAWNQIRSPNDVSRIANHSFFGKLARPSLLNGNNISETPLSGLFARSTWESGLYVWGNTLFRSVVSSTRKRWSLCHTRRALRHADPVRVFRVHSHLHVTTNLDRPSFLIAISPNLSEMTFTTGHREFSDNREINHWRVPGHPDILELLHHHKDWWIEPLRSVLTWFR